MATDGYANRINGVDYNAVDERRFDAPLLMPGPTSAPFSAKAGRRVNGAGLVVSVGGSPEAWTVTQGAGVIYDSAYASQGAWRFEIPNSVSANMPARPGAGTSRIDLIVARIYDTVAIGSGPAEVKVERVNGTAGSTPSAPSLPALSVELARLTVPASGTITVTQSTERTVAAGGILPVPTVAARDKLKTDGIAYEGLYVDVASTDSLERYDGTNWVPAKSSMVRLFTRVDASALYGQSGTIGTMAFPAIPVASRVVVDAQGVIGFVGLANQRHRVGFSVNAGTLVDGQISDVETGAGGTWAGYSKMAWVDVPANAAVTLTSTMYSTASGGAYWGGVHRAQRYLPGEYA